MEHNELDLSQLRQRIDQLDHEIARLLTERMEISGEVAAYKKANNLPIYHPSGKQVIEKVCCPDQSGVPRGAGKNLPVHHGSEQRGPKSTDRRRKIAPKETVYRV